MAFSIVYECPLIERWLIWNGTNAPGNNFVEIIEFCLFTYFMASIIQKPTFKRNIYVIASFILLLSFTNMLFVQGFWKRNTISGLSQCLFILTLVCTYYYILLNEAKEEIMLLKHPPFLAATGLLFYIASKSFFYSCFSYMAYKNNYHFYILAGIIPSLANLFLNFLLIVSFAYSSKTEKRSLQEQ
ncbi:hypothetical protein [Mucilaginibacter pineti]|nr:hypothetical protein [Mucilaginibacter pineti]